jgi:hypothetical protein
MTKQTLRATAAILSFALFMTSSITANAAYKPKSMQVLAVAMQTKCKYPQVYSNYGLGDTANWVKVSPYLKGSTYYYGIKFVGKYSVVAVTMGAKSATLKISNNGERFLRYVSGCPTSMSISYRYVIEYGEG